MRRNRKITDWHESGGIQMTPALEQIYPQIMTKIQFELSAKPSKADKKAKGQSGFVPVAARWVIERSNAWVDRCKSLYPIKRKDF